MHAKSVRNFKRYFIIYLFLLAICNLPFLLLWIHHRIVSGLNPFVGSVFLLLVLLISVLVGIKLFKWAGKNWFDDIKTEPVILFSVGLLSWNIDLITSWNSTMEFHIHDTYYVLSSFSVLLIGSFLFVIFCVVYYVIPTVFGKALNITYSRIHFWITYWALWFLFMKIHIDRTISFSGVLNQPRRYVEYSGWADYKYVQQSDRHLLIAVILLLGAQILLLFNITYTLLAVRRNRLKSSH